MKNVVIALLLCLSVFAVNAQEFEVPEDVVLEKAEDYKPYEEDILNAIDWLHETPLGKENSKRGEVSAFFLSWISGSPTVSIILSMDVSPYIEDSPDLLVAYMAGWTQYALTNNYSKDNVACAMAGTDHVIAFYLRNKPVLGKIKSIEKFIKKKEKGKLKDYISSKL